MINSILIIMKSLKKGLYFISILYSIIYIFFSHDYLTFLRGKVSIIIVLLLVGLIFFVEIYSRNNENKNN
jgi:hypothetical protein